MGLISMNTYPSICDKRSIIWWTRGVRDVRWSLIKMTCAVHIWTHPIMDGSDIYIKISPQKCEATTSSIWLIWRIEWPKRSPEQTNFQITNISTIHLFLIICRLIALLYTRIFLVSLFAYSFRFALDLRSFLPGFCYNLVKTAMIAIQVFPSPQYYSSFSLLSITMERSSSYSVIWKMASVPLS